MMYSEVGPSVMIKCKPYYELLQEDIKQIEQVSKGCSQIFNLKANVQFSIIFSDIKIITEQGSILWFYESSQVTRKCNKWQEK